MIKKSAKSPKVKPAKKKATVKSASKPGKEVNPANELRLAAKRAAIRRLNK
jgi:hypothetical protein